MLTRARKRRSEKKNISCAAKGGGFTYKQHHVVNVKNVFQEIHGTTTVVPGPKSGGGAG